MSQIICSPGCYIQGKGELKKLAYYCKDLGVQNAYIVVDAFIDEHYHNEIESSFLNNDMQYAIHRFGGECSLTEVNKHQHQLNNADIIIGIGGGKTLDTSKAIAYYENKHVMIVPTAASSDAPCSRLSVLYHDDGSFDHYLPLNKNPDIVVMDEDVIAKAPKRFLAAGIGDALATYYEARACYRSNATTMAGGHITNAAITLAKLCKDILLENGESALAAVQNGVCTKAVENIIEANTYLSGIGFESSGLAAAHAIHNGMTQLEKTHHFLHGEKVAFGLICQLVLENAPKEELEQMINFCRNCGLPTTFADLSIENVNDEQLMEVAIASCDKNDTMANMPFEVNANDVFAAMKTANEIAKSISNK